MYRAIRQNDIDGDGFYSRSTTAIDSGWTDFRDFVVADILGDNRDEIIGLSSDGNVYRATWNRSTNAFYSPARLNDATGWRYFSALTVGDWNGDGQADLAGIKGADLYRQIANADEGFYGLAPADGGVNDWSAIRHLG